MSRSRERALAAAALGVMLLGTAGLSALAQQPKPSQRSTSKLGLGREATPAEIKAWDIDVRPDGQGLPVGKGTAKQGEELFIALCASCHGEFGEGKDRWPALAGGHGTLKNDRPDKTVGSFWPAASTLFDYIKRAMPFGNAQSLPDDDIYALTAYVLHLNEIIKDPGFELNDKNFASIKMPNAATFYDDDREAAEKHFWGRKPCMKDCRKDAPKVTGQARALDVTPADAKTGPKVD